MDKSPLICSSKPSRLGDIICFLPFLKYINNIYPNSYQSLFIDKSCSQITPFLLNLDILDNIRISQEIDKIGSRDIEYFKKFDLLFNPYPQVTNPTYFNYHSVQKENFIMSELWTSKGWDKIKESEYDNLTPEDKFPRLNQWFDIENRPKTIALWLSSGYGNNDPTIVKRSPNEDWIEDLVDNLIKLDYNILSFGHPKSDYISGTFDCRNYSLFEAIQMSLGCSVTIQVESGPAHILGSYGAKQIVLHTNYLEGQFQNYESHLPMNHKNQLISIFGKDNINNINIESVLEEVKTLTT